MGPSTNQILASIDDINGFLPDLVEISDGEDRQFQIDAQRVIKSQLSGVFTPLVMVAWDAPADTPELIRGIAGRLIAAKYYSQVFSQESTGVSPFAQIIYNEAIGMLADIKRGVLVVLNSDGTPLSSGSALEPDSSVDLFPNRASAGPVFTMGAEFG